MELSIRSLLFKNFSSDNFIMTRLIYDKHINKKFIFILFQFLRDLTKCLSFFLLSIFI